jgi:hypothetical protein
MELAGTMLAMTQARQGKSAKRQYFRQAGAERASSQRDAETERRRALLLQSRALAVAAASGGGAEDPTVSKILADIGAQGEVNALGALWEGNEASEGLKAEGRSRQREGRAQAVSTILSMGADSAMKYA